MKYPRKIAIAAIGEALSPWYPHFRRKILFGTQWLDQIFVPCDPLCISVLFRQIPMFDANDQTCKSLNLLKSNMFVAYKSQVSLGKSTMFNGKSSHSNPPGLSFCPQLVTGAMASWKTAVENRRLRHGFTGRAEGRWGPAAADLTMATPIAGW